VEAVNLLVFIQKTNNGKKGRKVTSILELNGYDKKEGYLTKGVGL
jgi:Flp pilus assembly CpaF family ATPase